MQFGYFDDRNREYVITRPDTPLPWTNYLGSEHYFGIISHTAGGYSFYKDARLRRITRYRYNQVPLDQGGRYLYLRDNETGKYWSPSGQPVCGDTKLEQYSCRQGLGYSIIGSTCAGIAAHTRYFVPLDENLEIWQLTLANQRLERASLSLFSFIEFCLWDAQDDAANFQRNFSIGEVEIHDEVIYHKTEYRERRDHFAWFACSAPIEGFDTQREAFFGPGRGWDRPLVVERGFSANSIAHGWSPIGSHHLKLRLDPGEKREIIFALGYHQNPADQKFDPPESQIINKRTVRRVIADYRNRDVANAQFERLRDYWSSLLEICQVDTPDPHTNRMVNIWNAYQCMVTFNLSRSASYYESGAGRGFGFRDSNQDLLGFVHMTPRRARERILDLASMQLSSGGAYHQYQPLTRKSNKEIGSNFNDDPLWLIFGTAAYLKETGDWPILDEPVPFDNQPGSEQSLYEHLKRSFNYTLEHIGPHGLPLIGRADCDDCLNLNCFADTPGQSFQTTTNKDGQVAESVFIAGLFVLSAKELAAIARHRGLPDEATQYLNRSRWMAATVAVHGWDGDWFVRAYDDSGRKVGSKECAEGRIFIEPQGFCVMAGIGLEDGRARKLWIQSGNIWPRRTESCCSSRPTPDTTWNWERSLRIRPGIKKTPASVATTIRGS
jgi:cellobiose phosphorylase